MGYRSEPTQRGARLTGGSAKLIPALGILITLSTLSLLTLSLGSGSAAASASLTLRDMQGNTHDLDRQLAQGKNVVLAFWQSWCASCKREAPHLNDAVERHSDAIAFYGVIAGPDSSVDNAKVRKTATSWGFTHPQIRDRELELADTYQAHATPVIIVLGPDRKVLYRGHRLPKDWGPFRGKGPAGDAQTLEP